MVRVESKPVRGSSGRGKTEGGLWSRCTGAPSCEWTHEPGTPMSIACHRPGPSKGHYWRHLGASRLAEAQLSMHSRADDARGRPPVPLHNYKRSSDCLHGGGCFLHSFEGPGRYSERWNTGSIRSPFSTSSTVDPTLDRTFADPEFVNGVRKEGMTSFEAGRVVRLDNPQSWLKKVCL